MSGDSYTETTTQSWFSRIGGAFVGIIFGLILFIASFFLLFWNEGRAVQQMKILKEGKGLVQPISALEINPLYDQKLVHLSGKADTREILVDPEFGVHENALILSRVVEMYQWKEGGQSRSKKNIGGSETTTTTYSYKTTWSEELINSAHFKNPDGHANPGFMPYSSRQYTAREIKVGAFLLSDELKGSINNSTPLDITSDMPLPQALQGKAKIFDGRFYFGSDAQNPQVGDLQVKFRVARPCDVTIVAQQLNNMFGPYPTKAGGNILMLRTGTHSAEEMFAMAEKDNKILTWAIRAGGFFLMFFGLILLLGPLSVLADVLPFLGNIVGAGTGMIAFLISSVLSVLTVALAWLAYRPLIGIALIFIAGGIIFLLREKIREKRDMSKTTSPGAGFGK